MKKLILMALVMIFGNQLLAQGQCTKDPGTTFIGSGQTLNWYDDSGYQTDVNKNIVVQAGGTLIFESYTFIVRPSVSIVVKPGGVLRIVNATLQVNQNCGTNHWLGIRVEGHDDLPQFESTGKKLIRDEERDDRQGYLYIYNSTIRYMHGGTWDAGIRILEGAIIEAFNSTFIDNYCAISIEDYDPVEPQNWEEGNVLYNRSVIEKCTFSFELLSFTGYNYSDYQGFTHLQLINVRTITLFGNTFNNLYNWKTINRGMGIYSYNSSFTAVSSSFDKINDSGCPKWHNDSIRHRFEDLSIGILFYDNTDEKVNYFTSWFSRFHHCLRSIIIDGGGGPETGNEDAPRTTLWKNIFLFYEGQALFSNINDPYFISLENVKENYFYRNYFNTDHSGAFNFFKFETNTSANKTLMYRNQLYYTGAPYNPDIYGLYIQGDNSDVLLECNHYEELHRDYYITGTLGDQGSEDKSTGERYSVNGSPNNYNMYNSGGNFEIHYHLSDNDHPRPAEDNGNITATDISSTKLLNPCEPHKCDNTWESIDEKLFKTGLIMYPNPATDKVYILFPTNFIITSGKLHIIGSDGKMIKEITIKNTSSASIEISEIVSGLYYCRVITEDGEILSTKFIKQ